MAKLSKKIKYLLIEALMVILLVICFFAVRHYFYVRKALLVPLDMLDIKFIEEVRKLEQNAVFVPHEDAKIIKLYYGPNNEILAIVKVTEENGVGIKPGFQVSYAVVHDTALASGGPYYVIYSLLPVEDVEKLPETLRVRYSKWKPPKPEPETAIYFELPQHKIIKYTEENFYDKFVVENGFHKLNFKTHRIDFTSAQNAYPSLMVGAYIYRAFWYIEDKRFDLARMRENLEKAKYYALKANSDSVKKIYKNIIEHLINYLKKIQEDPQQFRSEQEFNSIVSLLEEYKKQI